MRSPERKADIASPPALGPAIVSNCGSVYIPLYLETRLETLSKTRSQAARRFPTPGGAPRGDFQGKRPDTVDIDVTFELQYP